MHIQNINTQPFGVLGPSEKKKDIVMFWHTHCIRKYHNPLQMCSDARGYQLDAGHG